MIGWETFITILSDRRFIIDNAGPLHSPIESFKIYRDDHLQICLETVCEATASTNRIDPPPGTVRRNKDFLEMTSTLGLPSRARINGVRSLTSNIVNGKTLTETSQISEVLIVLREDIESCYIVDWLANVDNRFYLWPDRSEIEVIETSEQVLKSGDVSIKATDKKTTTSISRSCICLIVGGYQLFLGIAQGVSISSSFMPGYILYKGVPTEEERKRIRLSLSFAFGRSFVYMGHSIFAEDWNIISSLSLSPHTIDGKVFELHTLPPAPLSQRSRNELESQEVSDFANAFYRYFNDYDLEYVSWLYWHSVASPTHMAALSFGATFEAIQQAYVKSKGEAFETRLLKKEMWSPVSKKIKKIVLDKSLVENMDSESRRRVGIIINKISNLNQAPPSELTKMFLDSLHIGLSEKEQKAWIQRNKAAHGSKTDKDDYIDLIKDTKLLRVLCNRVLLAITGASPQYIDYYSINFPIKNLREAVE